jgi:RNA polymerase sigma factor (sigma-70 family)
MTTKQLSKALQHLRRILRSSAEGGMTDGQLLARFVTSRDEAVFNELVRRHGPMVLGVCRRILRHTQDAEDAFQAAFFVLARKASSVANRQAVGSWLYRVSYRIALEAKAINDKRRSREKQVEDMPHSEVAPIEPRDWLPRLDYELNLLPEHYRSVIVACDLEGRSRKEAARELGLSEGTVSSRLARGRCLLAKRLSRYGLSLTGGVLTAALAEGSASAHVPVSLLSSTSKMVLGQVALSGSIDFLVKGALKTMLLAKLKLTVGAVILVTALGAAGLAIRATAEELRSPSAEDAFPSTKREADDLESLRLEIEALRRELRATTERVKRLEAKEVEPRDTLSQELNALRKQAESQDARATAEHEAASRHLRRWHETLRAGHTLNFHVKWVVRDKKNRVETARQGTLRMNGPGLFCLELMGEEQAEPHDKITVGEKAVHLFSFSNKEIVRFPITSESEWPTGLRKLVPPFLVGTGHGYELRLAKEDASYIYLDIFPRAEAGESEFRRGRLVLHKESGMPRQLWLEQMGREVLWDMPKREVGGKADPKEFDNLIVPEGWKLKQPVP